MNPPVMLGSPCRSQILIWQMRAHFAGEDQHRLAHRRVGPLLRARLGEQAPNVVHCTGSPSEVVALCANPQTRPDALILPAFRQYVWQSLSAIRQLSELAPELPILLSGWGTDPDYIDAICAESPISHPRFWLARGEVEEALVDALEVLGRGVGDDATREASLLGLGLALPDGRGGWKSRGRFRSVDDLSRLPSPYLSGAMAPLDAQGMVLIEVARGCLFRCGFCLSCNYPRQAARPFPLSRIRDEIHYAASHRAPSVGLLCSGLNYDVNVIEAVADELESIPEEHRPRVDSTIHASLLDDRRFRAVMRIPWGRMIVGMQTINPEALGLMRRELDTAHFRAAIERMSAFHQPVVEVILGLPGDSLEGFAATMKFALSLPADVEVYHLRLDPGSLFFHQRQALGIEADFTREGRVVSNPTFSTNDLTRATEILRQVASRPWRYRAKRLGFDFEVLYDGSGQASRSRR